MERAVGSTLAALLVSGCGLVLDVAPSIDAQVPTGDASTGAVDGDAGTPGPDAGRADGSSSADAATADAAVACTPAREACNGIDDDCDGVTDEHCDCARYVLAGATGTGTAPDDPIGTIGEAIESLSGEVGKVCVAAVSSDSGCTPATYTESVTMVDGISVLGGFRAGAVDPWDRTDPSCETILLTNTAVGVVFGATVSERTSLDGFTIRGGFNPGDSAAITVHGGGTISNNHITGDGRTTSRAIRLEGCSGTTRIVGNHSIVGVTEGTGVAYGIESTACTVLIERNAKITGRGGGTGQDAAGIACRNASSCTIQNNAEIVGVETGAAAGAASGVTIETAGGSVLGNGAVAACRGTASEGCQGISVVLSGAGTLVDGNVVEPGRGEWNAGIRVVHTTAMVSNNLVTVDWGTGIDLGIDPMGATETTVHSNTVVTYASDAARAARLLVVDAEGPVGGALEPSGIFRNNIAVCLGGSGAHASFAEASAGTPPPRVLENNDLWGCGSPYVRGTGTMLSPAEIAPVLSSSSVSGNISEDPLFVDAAAGDYHLSPASLLIDSGTGSGPAPVHDFDGEARSQGRAPDIGFDETDVTRP